MLLNFLVGGKFIFFETTQLPRIGVFGAQYLRAEQLLFFPLDGK